LVAGSYTLWLQDDSVRGCILPHPTPIVVPQPDSLVAAFEHSEPDCGGNNTITLRFFNAVGGSGAYAFSADGGATWMPMAVDTLTLTDIPVGLRQLRIRDAALPSCSFPIADTLITPFNPITATVSTTPLTGCGSGDGSISLSNPLGGSGSYEYSLDSLTWQTDPTFTNLAEGAYPVYLRDSNRPVCAIKLQEEPISAPGGVSGTLVVLPVTACAEPWDGGLRFDNLSGGSGTYECSVDDGATWEPLSAANNPRQGIAPGSILGIWMRDANNPSCRFRLRDRVDFARPAAVAVDNDTLVCAESTTDFQPRRGLPAGGSWSSPDITGVNPGTGRFDVGTQTPGNSVRLVYSHPVFCADTFEVYLSPHPSAAFVATPPLTDTLFLPNAALTLALPNYVPGETVRVLWGDGNESVANAATFGHNYAMPGSFPLRIEVMDVNTCQTTDGPFVVNVVRPLPDPRVPNTFTPNGDGVNDTWRIELDNTRELQAALYNRWGFEVWNARAEGNVLVWDGRTAKGDAPAGVYFYRLEFKLVTGEKRVISGSLTLLR
jgi:gliding motility-associated-like protein